eukprot:1190190-Prorocentrum_minimum.AAC.1
MAVSCISNSSHHLHSLRLSANPAFAGTQTAPKSETALPDTPFISFGPRPCSTWHHYNSTDGNGCNSSAWLYTCITPPVKTCKDPLERKGRLDVSKLRSSPARLVCPLPISYRASSGTQPANSGRMSGANGFAHLLADRVLRHLVVFVLKLKRLNRARLVAQI